MLLTPSTIAALEAAARAAPSADNRHVHRLRFDPDRVRVLDDGRLASELQNRRVLGMMSIGAVTENLILRGGALGLGFRAVRHDPGRPDSLLVDLVPESRPAVGEPLAEAIDRRHSNRRLAYGRGALAATELQMLGAEAAAIPGASVVWLDGPDRRPLALRLIRWAESERFRQPDLHKEMFESIRFDVGWKVDTAEGIPPGALELPVLERGAFTLLRHWKMQRLANLFGAHRFIGFRGGDLPCRLAPNLGAIAVESANRDDAAYLAGRLLQRVWLRATALGFTMQVFAASPLYALDGSDFVTPALRLRLATGWRKLSPGAVPYAVFRLGRASPATLRAGRPGPTAG